jgi:sulfatase modifying factor 1
MHVFSLFVFRESCIEMKSLFTRLVLAAYSMLTLGNYVQAGVVSFGSGTNQFNMEFVTIGNPGNAADTTGNPNPAGSVGYVYGIGKYEVKRQMVNQYNSVYGTAQSLEITLADLTAYGGNGVEKPATMSWNNAARFINWLSTSKGGNAAYKFTTSGVNDNITPWSVADTQDYDPLNPYRSRRATFALPTYNEWYKAAYYNPATSAYFNYATGSDSIPASVASGTSPGTAVWYQPGPANVEQAGGLSPYGVMGLAGNAWDWEETSHDLLNNSGGSNRGIRGGSWFHGVNELNASWRNSLSPFSAGDGNIGFRVVMVGSIGGGQVPEPTSMAILGLGALGMAYRTRRKAKA